MKVYKSQKEFEKEIRNGKFHSNQSIDISAFDLYVWADIEVNGKIKARNIKAKDIQAHDIDSCDIAACTIKAQNIDALQVRAWDIYAKDLKTEDIIGGNINARNIKTNDINAGDIKAKDIDGRNINARNIKARDIRAMDISSRGNITARNINYYAVMFAYNNIKAKTIQRLIKNGKHFALDGKITLETFHIGWDK